MAHAFGTMLMTGTAVVIAGILLGLSADRIANVTDLGELWTGWVLLAGGHFRVGICHRHLRSQNTRDKARGR